jgi:3-phosphoshikimate 1-carboxyvinyltransferase
MYIDPKQVILPKIWKSLPSKSQTMRALLLGAFAQGVSNVKGALLSNDAFALIKALEALGARFRIEKNRVTIFGIDKGQLRAPKQSLDLCNSGIALRFLSALCATFKVPVTLTGDSSLRQRPMQELTEALNALGVRVESAKGFAPLTIQGPAKQGLLRTRIRGEDSQPVSALLLLGSLLNQPIEIRVTHPGEKPWVDLTLSWLDRLGISYEREGYSFYRVRGQGGFQGFDYEVPADLSTLSYPVAAAIVLNQPITATQVDFSDPQGDKALFDVLADMGAQIKISNSRLQVERPSFLSGRTIDINSMIDALPILATLGCLARGETHIIGAEIARTKECDRVHVMAKELKKMGADIYEKPGGLLVKQSALCGAKVDSHGDHRIGMSLAIAALFAKGPTELKNPGCIEKTFPNFFEELYFSFA